MMDILPKVLLSALENLCGDEILYNWNIGSYNNITSVTIKFVKPGHIGSTPVTGMRRKSQSYLKRDRERLNMWKLNQESSMFETSPKREQNDIETLHGFNGKTQDIGIATDDPHSENSSMHGLEASGHASLEVTKTKTCDNSEVKSVQNITNVLQSHDSSDMQDTASVHKDSPHVQEQTSESGENYIDPAKYFSKIVTDFRSVVVHPTVRGLTWSGEIVNYEYDRPQKRLYVTHGYSDMQGYDWYMKHHNIISTFSDQRYSTDWAKTVQDFMIAYEKYISGNR